MQVVIYKASRTLALYRGGRFDKQYAVVLGLSPEGRKRHEGDARTPEGLYRVVGRREHAKWQYFLALDYPNEADRRAYDSEVARGRIPIEDGKPLGIGSAIGIHGNDRPAEQESGKDWTKGCIALGAEDARELAAAVPVGTPVWIVE
ncbi:MAG: murein L,D-transpeptidase family protein [Candidatus Binatia bacterium]